MNIEQLNEKIAQLQSADFGFANQPAIGKPSRYDVRNSWSEEIPNAGSNGVYVFTSMEETVLYIGKTEQSSGDGLGRRVCAHFGKPAPGAEIMFPNHKMTNTNNSHDIIEIIRTGKFLVWTIPITPDYYACLAEVFLLTAYFDTYKSLPPLNKQIC